MISHLLNRSCEIVREVTQPDGYGGNTTTDVVVATENFRIAQPTSVVERMGQGRWRGEEQAFNVYGEPTTVCRRGDILKGTHPDSGEVEEYRVIGRVDPSKSGVYSRFYAYYYDRKRSE